MAKKLKSRKFKLLSSPKEQEEIDRELSLLTPNLNFEYESETWQLVLSITLMENRLYNIKLPNLRVYINTIYKDNCFYISKNRKIDKKEVEFCYLVS